NPAFGSVPLSDQARIYLHLLKASFEIKSAGANQVEIMEPEHDDPRKALLTRLRASPGGTAVLINSPVVVFPAHEAAVTVPLPTQFVAGLLTLHVTAVDSAIDVKDLQADGTTLTGNESLPAELLVSARSLSPPGPPEILFDPKLIIWATTAAEYEEDAT